MTSLDQQLLRALAELTVAAQVLDGSTPNTQAAMGAIEGKLTEARARRAGKRSDGFSSEE